MKTLIRFVVVLVSAVVVTASAPHAEDKLPSPPKPEVKVEVTPTTGFEPGSFLTADDYEYVVDALDRVALTPEDLCYEKKHIAQRFTLPICAKCLDQPLTVPNTAEETSSTFGLKNRLGDRAQYAAKLLKLDPKRWSIDEIQADVKPISDSSEAIVKIGKDLSKLRPKRGEQPSDEYKAKEKENSEARAADEKRSGENVFGGVPQLLLEAAEHVDEKTSLKEAWSFAAALEPLVLTIQRKNAAIKPKTAEALAIEMPSMFFDSDDADQSNRPALCAKPEGFTPLSPEHDSLDCSGDADLAGIMLAAARTDAVLEQMSGNWSSQVKLQPADFAGKSGNFGKLAAVPGVTGGIVAAWQGPRGKFVIGGTGPNTYEGDDFIGIIDLGGNDIYRGRVACAVGLPGRSPVSFVLDLAGDDIYLGTDFTQGFGFMGVGILWDLGAGNDIYRARNCAQACGLIGYGELYDDGGGDIYDADCGSQGAACFGYGQLIDASGRDCYRGCRYVQGFAQVMGVGVLTDGAGNDSYYAGGQYLHAPLWNDHWQSLSQGFSIGNRNDTDPAHGSGGGVGALIDEGDGNDVYSCDIYGLGASYWYSLGMLVDKGGNDNYTLAQYGMGGGIHLSTGILVDVAGNDCYTDYYGVGHGGAHDYAVGWLIDRAGNDMYSGNGQGHGLNFSIGILLDCAGDDSHSTNNDGCIGKGSNNSVSMCIDLGGTDFYGPKEIVDGQITRRAEHELVYDIPTGWFKGCDKATLPTVQTPAPKKVTIRHILISFDGHGMAMKYHEGEETRNEVEAEALVRKVLKLSRTKGADWEALEKTYSEYGGNDGDDDEFKYSEYEVTADAKVLPEFKEMGLSLGVGQIAVAKRVKYGWYIIKRVK